MIRALKVSNTSVWYVRCVSGRLLTVCPLSVILFMDRVSNCSQNMEDNSFFVSVSAKGNECGKDSHGTVCEASMFSDVEQTRAAADRFGWQKRIFNEPLFDLSAQKIYLDL